MTPPAWPGGKRVAVAITFDLDGGIAWGHPGDVSLSALSRGQFGFRAGLGRILQLLEQREIPATFFIPAIFLDLQPEALSAIQQSGRHEIGYHGYAHENVATLTEVQEREVMRRGMAMFAKTGVVPRTYRSPSWQFTPSTLKILREHGFRFDSSLMADDRPYELLSRGQPTGVIELPVDWSLDDWPYFQLEWATPMPGLRSPGEVLDIWREEFEGVRSDGGLFVLTLHPQVIGRWSRFRMLERLLDHIASAGDVWFATLGEIGDYVTAMKPE